MTVAATTSTPAPSARWAWLLAAVSTALLGAGAVVQLTLGPARPLGELVVAVLVLAVGTLLTVRRPGNRVGWTYAVSAHGFAWLALGGSVTAASPRPLAIALAWVGSWAWLVAFSLPVTFGLLWFPDGRLPSPRWRAVEMLLAGAYVIAAASATLMPYEVVGVDAPFANPFALPRLRWLLEPAFLVAAALIVLGGLVAAASVAVRLRRARGVERLQLKWVAYAGLAGVVLFLGGDLLTRLPLLTWDAIYTLGIGLPSAAVTLAILRYRLFDIDRIVSRTLAYAVITVLLAGVYAVSVVALRFVFAPLTGDSDLAVAGSTLAVAALFGPVRRRVQSLVDRRFNRARYDAARTVQKFGQRLRDDVALDVVRAELARVVTATVQPAQLSLWLPAQPVGDGTRA